MEVINHIEIGVSDVEASRRFYEAALAPLGLSRVISVEASHTIRGTARFGFGRNGYPSFWIHGEAGEHRPVHIALTATSRTEVDEFHEHSLANGAIDNGPPGVREHYHPRYYAAYVLDLDGNNIEAVCQTN